MSSFHRAALFLIESLFDFYLLILLLRFLFQWWRIDYYNPISQFVDKLTSPVISPLRGLLPEYRGMDLATLCLLSGICMCKLIFITLLTYHRLPNLGGLLLWTLGDLCHLGLKLFFYAILANIILSWLAPTMHSPVTAILSRLTAPLLHPARKWIPPFGGFDLSPIPVIIGLQLLMILISEPLIQLGFTWSISK